MASEERLSSCLYLRSSHSSPFSRLGLCSFFSPGERAFTPPPTHMCTITWTNPTPPPLATLAHPSIPATRPSECVPAYRPPTLSLKLPLNLGMYSKVSYVRQPTPTSTLLSTSTATATDDIVSCLACIVRVVSFPHSACVYVLCWCWCCMAGGQNRRGTYIHTYIHICVSRSGTYSRTSECASVRERERASLLHVRRSVARTQCNGAK